MNPILNCLTTSVRFLLLSVPEKFSGLKNDMIPPGLERKDSYRYLAFQKTLLWDINMKSYPTNSYN